MRWRAAFAILGIGLASPLIPVHGQQLYSLQTRDLTLVYYSKGHEYLVPHLARCFENALRFHERLFDYTPSEPVTLLLQDFGDYASGGANTVPLNLIGIGISPFSYSYETMPPSERMSLMMNHELAHIATMDNATPADRFFRSLFLGKVHPTAEAPPSMLYSYLTSPRWNSPRWYIEGIAVFLETWMGGGLGRALGAYDEMVFRTMVRDSAYFYDMVGLESEGTKVDFQVGAASYLYGTRFVSYLALLYGPEKLIAWYKQAAGSREYFASQFAQTFGRPLEEEWDRWIAWERRWQRGNLDSLRAYPATPERVLAAETIGSVSRAYYDPARKELYAGVNYPGQRAHLAAIDAASGRVRRLQDIQGGALFYVTALAFDPDTRTLFYTTNNNQWRDLYAFDLENGASRLLIEKARTGDLTFDRADRSLWGVRHFNGISTIVRIPFPYTEWHQVYSWDYGLDVFDLDISPDGTMLTAALGEVTGRQRLIALDVPRLLRGDASYRVLHDFENSSPANFAFSADGKHLVGTTYYSGVSNVVRYDLADSSLHWISNVETGLFRPVLAGSDSVIAFHFSGRGFVPVIIPNRTVEDINAIRYLGQEVVERHPQLKQWTLPPPSPAAINLDSLTTYRGAYSPMGHIALTAGYPVVEGYKDYTALGARFEFADALMLHNIDVTASYTPAPTLARDERVHAAFNYKFWEWRLKGTWNAASFYDLFGPTKLSRKGYSLSLSRHDYLLFDEPEVLESTLTLGGYGGLEQLPDYQNVSASADRLYWFDGLLHYKRLYKSLGAVEDEEGWESELGLRTNAVRTTAYPQLHAAVAWGFLLPIDHSSLWWRLAAGHGFGDRHDPFANYYFGGFGNNWVDHQNVRRYREPESFPGIPLNEAGGVTFGKAGAEWDLPPLRFRRAGMPVLYCTWARLALFSSVLVTNPEFADARRMLADAGGQVDFQLVIGSSLSATLSAGAAVAAERGRHPVREFMFSIKIL